MSDSASGFATVFHRSGMSLENAQEVLGVSSVQIRRYVKGTCPVPRLVADKVAEIATARVPERGPGGAVSLTRTTLYTMQFGL